MPKRKSLSSRQRKNASHQQRRISGNSEYDTEIILGAIVFCAVVWGLFNIFWQLVMFVSIVGIFTLIAVLFKYSKSARSSQITQTPQPAHTDSTLKTIFYNLIRQNQGKIALMDLAMAANVTGKEAKQFLDERAREFDAHFDVTDEGDIIYVFTTGTLRISRQSQPVIQLEQLKPQEFHQEPQQEQPQVNRVGPLNQVQLAGRLMVSASTISHRKYRQDFTDWSKQKDPEGRGWIFIHEKFFDI